jgi:putative hydrolase of the HAD superfamily
VRAAIWDSGFEDVSDAGGYPDAGEYLREFQRRLGYPLSKQQWVEARREAMVVKADVIDIARAIARQAPLAIYTNNGPLVKDNFDTLLPDVRELFTFKHCSYEFGTKKPDPEAFTRLTTALQRAPGECWFIDDKKSNVEGARIAGLAGHHFRNADLLRAEANTLGFAI